LAEVFFFVSRWNEDGQFVRTVIKVPPFLERRDFPQKNKTQEPKKEEDIKFDWKHLGLLNKDPPCSS
jgi:hypothetical protein